MGNPSRTSGDWWATRPASPATTSRPGRTFGASARQQLRNDIAAQQAAAEAQRQQQIAMIAAIGMNNQQGGQSAAPAAQVNPLTTMTPEQFAAVLGNLPATKQTPANTDAGSLIGKAGNELMLSAPAQAYEAFKAKPGIETGVNLGLTTLGALATPFLPKSLMPILGAPTQAIETVAGAITQHIPDDYLTQSLAVTNPLINLFTRIPRQAKAIESWGNKPFAEAYRDQLEATFMPAQKVIRGESLDTKARKWAAQLPEDYSVPNHRVDERYLFGNKDWKVPEGIAQAERDIFGTGDAATFALQASANIAFSGEQARYEAVQRITTGERPEVILNGSMMPADNAPAEEQERFKRDAQAFMESRARIARVTALAKGVDRATAEREADAARKEAGEIINASGMVPSNTVPLAEMTGQLLIGITALDPVNKLPLHKVFGAGILKKIPIVGKIAAKIEAALPKNKALNEANFLDETYNAEAKNLAGYTMKERTEAAVRGLSVEDVRGEKNAKVALGNQDATPMMRRAARWFTAFTNAKGYTETSQAHIRDGHALSTLGEMALRSETPADLIRNVAAYFKPDMLEMDGPIKDMGGLTTSVRAEIARPVIEKVAAELPNLPSMQDSAGALNVAKFMAEVDGLTQRAANEVAGVKPMSERPFIERINYAQKKLLGEFFLRTPGYVVRNALNDTVIAAQDGLYAREGFREMTDYLDKFGISAGDVMGGKYGLEGEQTGSTSIFSQPNMPEVVQKTVGKWQDFIGNTNNKLETERRVRAFGSAWKKLWTKQWMPEVSPDLSAKIGGNFGPMLDNLKAAWAGASNEKELIDVTERMLAPKHVGDTFVARKVMEKAGINPEAIAPALLRDIQKVINDLAVKGADDATIDKAFREFEEQVLTRQREAVASMGDVIHPREDSTRVASEDLIEATAAATRSAQMMAEAGMISPIEAQAFSRRWAQEMVAAENGVRDIQNEALARLNGLRDFDPDTMPKVVQLFQHAKNEEMRARDAYRAEQLRLETEARNRTSKLNKKDTQGRGRIWSEYHAANDANAKQMYGTLQETYKWLNDSTDTLLRDPTQWETIAGDRFKNQIGDVSAEWLTQQMASRLDEEGLQGFQQNLMNNRARIDKPRQEAWRQASLIVKADPTLAPDVLDVLMATERSVQENAVKTVMNTDLLRKQKSEALKPAEWRKAINDTWNKWFDFAEHTYGDVANARLQWVQVRKSPIATALREMGYADQDIARLLSRINEAEGRDAIARALQQPMMGGTMPQEPPATGSKQPAAAQPAAPAAPATTPGAVPNAPGVQPIRKVMWKGREVELEHQQGDVAIIRFTEGPVYREMKVPASEINAPATQPAAPAAAQLGVIDQPPLDALVDAKHPLQSDGDISAKPVVKPVSESQAAHELTAGELEAANPGAKVNAEAHKGEIVKAIDKGASVPVEVAAQYPETYEKATGRPSPENPIRGNTTTATGADPNTSYQFRYRLVSLDDLIASQLDTLEPNPAYPQELQPRDRSRASSQVQIDNIAQKLNPDALLRDAGQIDRGSPITGADNVVESGNGRVLAMRKARQDNPAGWQRYQDTLRSRLDEFGIDPARAEGMKDLVLVRERVSNVDRAQFAAEANQSSVLTMSPFEVARQDSARVDDVALQGMEIGDTVTIDQAILSPRNKRLVTEFLGNMPANERAALLTEDGNLNAEGLRRIKTAMFSKTYGGEAGARLAKTFAESTDSEIANVQNGLFASLPRMAQADSLIKAGARDAAYGVADDVAAAVDVYARLKNQGISVSNYLGQQSFFERELTPFQEQVLGWLSKNSRSAKQIREGLNAYAEMVKNQPATQQDSLIAMPPVTKEAMWDIATGQPARLAMPEGEYNTRNASLRISESGQGGAARGDEATGAANLAQQSGRGNVGEAGSGATDAGSPAGAGAGLGRSAGDADATGRDAIPDDGAGGAARGRVTLQPGRVDYTNPPDGVPEVRVPTRPGTTPTQIALGQSVLEELIVRAELPETGKINTLLTNITDELIDTSKFTLIGKQITNADELATAAQVFRDPRFETARYFFVSADGTIIGESAFTSRLPGSSAVFTPNGGINDLNTWLNSQIAKHAAAGVWMVHNHPSGRAIPSDPDLRATGVLNGMTGGKVLGHVIIDSGEYAHIQTSGDSINVTHETLKKDFGADKLIIGPNGPSADSLGILIGHKIRDAGNMATVAKIASESAPDKPVLIGVAGNSGVRAVASIDMPDLSSERSRVRALAQLRAWARQNGTSEMFLVLPDALPKSGRTLEAFEDAIRVGIVRDVADFTGNSVLRNNLLLSRRSDMRLGTPVDRGYLVKERKGRYNPAQADLFAAGQADMGLSGSPMERAAQRIENAVTKLTEQLAPKAPEDTGAFPGGLFEQTPTTPAQNAMAGGADAIQRQRPQVTPAQRIQLLIQQHEAETIPGDLFRARLEQLRIELPPAAENLQARANELRKQYNTLTREAAIQKQAGAGGVAAKLMAQADAVDYEALKMGVDIKAEAPDIEGGLFGAAADDVQTPMAQLRKTIADVQAGRIAPEEARAKIDQLVSVSPAGSGSADVNATELARMDAEIAQLESRIRRLKEVTDAPQQYVGSSVTGGSNRSASLDRKSIAETNRWMAAGKELGDAQQRLTDLKARRDLYVSGEVHTNGQPRQDAPSRQRAQSAKETIANYLRKTLRPGDQISVGGNTPVTVKRINANTITDEMGEKWNYNQITPIENGKPLDPKTFLQRMKEWERTVVEEPESDYDANGLPNPDLVKNQDEAVEQGQREGVHFTDLTGAATRESLDAIKSLRDGYKQHLKDNPTVGAVPADVRAAIMSELENVTQAFYDTRRNVKQQAGSLMNDSLLDYNLKRGFDKYMGLIAPFSYWATRQGRNYALRFMTNPQLLAGYLKYQYWTNEQHKKEQGSRARFGGGWKVPTSALSEVLPGNPDVPDVYVDPTAILFPFGQWITSNEMDNADAAKSTIQDLYDRAGAVGARLSPLADIPLRMSGALMTKRPGEDSYDKERAAYGDRSIGQFIPQTGMIQGATALAGIGGPTGVDIERPVRKALGLPEAEAFDPYRISRSVSNMAATDNAKALRAGQSFDAVPYLAAQQFIAQHRDSDLPTALEQYAPDRLAKELGIDQSVATRALEIARDAAGQASRERGIAQLSSAVLGVRAQPQSQGEQTRWAMRGVEKGAAYSPYTEQGGRADVKAVQQALPALQVQRAQYGSLPGETKDYGYLVNVAQKDQINARFDQVKDAIVAMRPWDRKAARAVENARWRALQSVDRQESPDQANWQDELQKALLGASGIESPNATVDYRPVSVAGASPKEAMTIRQNEVMRFLSDTKPLAENFVSVDTGEIDFDSYNAAVKQWERNLPRIAAGLPQVAAVVAQADQEKRGDALRGWLAQLNPNDLAAYRQRNDTPIEGAQRAWFDGVYTPTFEAYRKLKDAGDEQAYEKTIGAVGVMNAQQLAAITKQVYGNKWGDAELEAKLGNMQMPALVDVMKANMSPQARAKDESRTAFWDFYRNSTPPGRAGYLMKDMAMIQAALDPAARATLTAEQYKLATSMMRGWVAENVGVVTPEMQAEWTRARTARAQLDIAIVQRYGRDGLALLAQYEAMPGGRDKEGFRRRNPAVNGILRMRGAYERTDPIYAKYYGSGQSGRRSYSSR